MIRALSPGARQPDAPATCLAELRPRTEDVSFRHAIGAPGSRGPGSRMIAVSRPHSGSIHFFFDFDGETSNAIPRKSWHGIAAACGYQRSRGRNITVHTVGVGIAQAGATIPVNGTTRSPPQQPDRDDRRKEFALWR